MNMHMFPCRNIDVIDCWISAVVVFKNKKENSEL